MKNAGTFEQLMNVRPVGADLRNRSIRATAQTALASGGDLVLRVISSAVLARLLPPEDFGIVMMVTAITAIADQLRDLGLSTATVQKPSITNQEVSNLFWINCGAGVAITLLTCICSPLIAMFYRDSRVIPITCALAATFALNGLIVQHQALLARTLRLSAGAWIRLAASAISTAVAVGMAVQDFGYWSLVWREVIRIALLAVGLWVCMPWVPLWPSFATDVRGLVKFGAHLSASHVVVNAASSVDRFLLGRLWGPVSVGIYRQAYQLLIVPIDGLLGPVYQVAPPSLSLLQDDPVRFRQFYCALLTFVCVATMPLSLFAAVYAEEAVEILLGADWADCAPIVRILCCGGFMRQAIYSASLVLVIRGRSDGYLRLTIAGAMVSITLMGVGVSWGAIGLAIAVVATEWVMLVPRLQISLADSPVTVADFVRTILRPAAASWVMAIVILFVRAATPHSSSVGRILIGAFIGACVFIAVWLLIPGGSLELRRFVSYARAAVAGDIGAQGRADPVARSI